MHNDSWKPSSSSLNCNAVKLLCCGSQYDALFGGRILSRSDKLSLDVLSCDKCTKSIEFTAMSMGLSPIKVNFWLFSFSSSRKWRRLYWCHILLVTDKSNRLFKTTKTVESQLESRLAYNFRNRHERMFFVRLEEITNDTYLPFMLKILFLYSKVDYRRW